MSTLDPLLFDTFSSNLESPWRQQHSVIFNRYGDIGLLSFDLHVISCEQ